MPTQPEGRHPLEEIRIPVHLLPVDGTVENLATYYGLRPENVFQHSMQGMRRQWGSYLQRPYEAFYRAVQPGRPGVRGPRNQYVMVPIPPAERGVEFQFLRVTDTLTTLQVICDQHNQSEERRAARMDELTPLSLWRLLANRSVREYTLAAYPESEAAAIDAHPTRDLPVGVLVAVPYPIQAAGAAIQVPPNPAIGASPGNVDGPTTTTVNPVPPWVMDLVVVVMNPLEAEVSELENLNERATQLAQEGSRSTVTLSVIRQILARMLREGSRGQTTVQALDRAVATLQDDAARVLVMEPLRYLDPTAHRRRRVVAEHVLAELRGDAFKGWVIRAFTDPDVDVNSESLRGRINRLLIRAYRALAHSHVLDEAEVDVNQALSLLATSTIGAAVTPPQDSPTALAAAASVASGTISVTTATVGALPGPASLAGAIVEISIARALPAVVRAGAVDASLLGRYRSCIMRIAAMSEAEIHAFELEVMNARTRAGVQAQIEPLIERFNQRFMTSRGWGGAMSILSLYALLLTIDQDDAITARKWSNVIGGTVNTALGVLQFVGAFAEGGVFAGRMAATVMNGVGAFAAVLSIVSGVLTVYEGLVKEDDAILRSGLVAVGSGAIVLAGFAFGIPGLQAVGLLVIVLSTSASNWEAIQQMLTHPMARVFRAQITAFRERGALARTELARHEVAIGSAWEDDQAQSWATVNASITAVENAISAAERSLSVLERNAENIDFLTTMGFQRTDVDTLIAPIPTPMPMFTPVGFGM